ncbi:MAG: helix-turn-helix transcriptional regulator [Clostridia bacterium]|nr:helix-turn-helix transcriptional regulator [Clostridia bacterium]
MDFYDRFSELRAESGLTAPEIATRLNFSKNLIYAWEHKRAQPNIETLVKLARIFNVTVDYLIGNTDELGNVAPGEDLSEEEKKLVLCYRGIGKAERLALMTTAQSFYNQARDSKNKVII